MSTTFMFSNGTEVSHDEVVSAMNRVFAKWGVNKGPGEVAIAHKADFYCIVAYELGAPYRDLRPASDSTEDPQLVKDIQAAVMTEVSRGQMQASFEKGAKGGIVKLDAVGVRAAKLKYKIGALEALGFEGNSAKENAIALLKLSDSDAEEALQYLANHPDLTAVK